MKRVYLFLILSLFLYEIHAQQTTVFQGRGLTITESPNSKDYNLQRRQLFDNIAPTLISSGVLYDRVLPISNIEKYSGTKSGIYSSKKSLRQVYFELTKADNNPKKINSIDALEILNTNGERVLLSVLDYQYQVIKEDAESKGLIRIVNDKYEISKRGTESPFELKNVFMGSALKESIYNGSSVVFNLDQSAYLTNLKDTPKKVEIDFDDGYGFRQVSFDIDLEVNYNQIGEKSITVKLTRSNNDVVYSKFKVNVVSLSIPAYTSISLKSEIPYNGILASGTAYVFKSPKTSQILNPIIISEGFDIGNDMFAAELYNLLNQQNLAESLLNNGYDIIILNYSDPKTYIQANAMLFVKLVKYVNETLKVGNNSNVIIGASMGGLVTRYALKYMENHNMPHEARLFATFDSPHKGANVPLGDQYWIDFFASESDEAATKINQLNSIAAQQMLVYHHLSHPQTNSLHTSFYAELNAMGFPQNCRIVALSNGTGNGVGEPYGPGAQIVSWRYRNWKVDIDGNAWAVPNGSPMTEISHCRINPFGPLNETYHYVSVSGTKPYDNAPGGWRATNQQIADSPVDYGDITTTNPNHCFIPTISSLAIDTDNLFYNISGDPNILSKTPFDAIYYPKTYSPSTNQEHIFISSETFSWVINEIVPETVILDGNTWNKGEVRAKNTIQLRPGFSAIANSDFNTNIYSFVKAASSMLKSSTVNNNEEEIIETKDELSITSPEKEFQIFPNPCKGELNIKLPSSDFNEVEVINLTGGIVLKEKLNSDFIKLYLGDIKAGTYIVRISNSTKVLVKKMVVSQ